MLTGKSGHRNRLRNILCLSTPFSTASIHNSELQNMTFEQKYCLLLLKVEILVLQKETHMLQALQPQPNFKKVLFAVLR